MKSSRVCVYKRGRMACVPRSSSYFASAMAPNHRILCILVVFSLAIAALSDDYCVYTMYVRTGSTIKGGTDSIISARLYDRNGWYVEIPNLEAWGGIMEPGHNYYEMGNLDIFSGRAPCLTAPVCALNLTSDGSGDRHGWYCNYVEVTSTGAHMKCTQQQFKVEQWLASDIAPFELTAIRNFCQYSGDRLSHSARKASSSSSGSVGEYVIMSQVLQ